MEHLDFVEIGTSDFDTLLQKSPEGSIGFSIEPISIYLNKLPNRQNITKIQMLISDEIGIGEINYIHPNDITKYKLPYFVKGMNTIDKQHPGYDVFNIDSIKTNNIEIHKETIQKTTLYQLLFSRGIKTVGYLKIDTEGHDCIILDKFMKDIIHNDDYNMLPNTILFESNQWTLAETIKNTLSLYSNYYLPIIQGHDTILVKLKR